MIAIIDYGVGNLFSLKSSLLSIGADCVVTDDPTTIESADKIILPGVGAFEDAVKKLRDSGLDKLIIRLAKQGKPLMGICLGMQLLFERSYEYGCHEGLGLIKGDILPFEGRVAENIKIPHIGWNALYNLREDCPLWKHIKEGEHVYFVHSFFAQREITANAATTEYDIEFTAAIMQDNILACQFHPEKSGETGLNILRGFCEIGETVC